MQPGGCRLHYGLFAETSNEKETHIRHGRRPVEAHIREMPAQRPFPPTTVKVADFPSGNSFNVMVLPDKKKAL